MSESTIQILDYLPTLRVDDVLEDGLYPFSAPINQQQDLAQSLHPHLDWSGLSADQADEHVYPLVLVKDRGHIYAFHDECPHRRLPISEQGYIDTERNLVMCGFHRWGFDLSTGKHMIPTGNCIKSFLTYISDQYIWVERWGITSQYTY